MPTATGVPRDVLGCMEDRYTIRVGYRYWRDYPDWPWTLDRSKAKVFTKEAAEKIVTYWNSVHRGPVVKDGKVERTETQLGSVSPLHAVVERYNAVEPGDPASGGSL